MSIATPLRELWLVQNAVVLQWYKLHASSCILFWFETDWLSSQIVVILNNIKTKVYRKHWEDWTKICRHLSDSGNNISATFSNWNLSQRVIYLNRGDLIIKKLKWRITDLFTKFGGLDDSQGYKNSLLKTHWVHLKITSNLTCRRAKHYNTQL